MDFNNQNNQSTQNPNSAQPPYPGQMPNRGYYPPYNYVHYPPKKEKPKPHFTRLDFFAYPVIFVLFYVFLKNVFDDLASLHITLSYWGIFGMATACIVAKTKKFPLKAVFPGLICLISSISFALHEDSLVQIGVLCLLVLFSGIYCICLTDANVHSPGSIFFLLDVVWCELFRPIEHIFMPASSMHNNFKLRRRERVKKGKKKKLLPFILGLVAGLLILAIVLPLLMDSDLVFEKLFGSLVDNIGRIFSKIFEFIRKALDIEWGIFFLTLILTPFVFSVIFAFGSGVIKTENIDTSAKYRKLRKVPSAFFASALGVVSVIYVIYLISQSAYLFSAFTGHLPFGLEISVTEYARQGFFEMLKIAFINFTLIFLSVGICKRNGEGISMIIKAFGVFLCAFNILACSISISKILLYIKTYGLTEKRLLVFIADIVLIAVFVTIIIRFFVSRLPYMQIILFVGSIAITITALLGVSSTVSRYNANAVIEGKISEISMSSFYEDAGVAAIPYIQKIASSDSAKSEEAERFLNEYYNTSDIYRGSAFNLDARIYKNWLIEKSRENDEIKIVVDLEDLNLSSGKGQIISHRKVKAEKSFEIVGNSGSFSVSRSELSEIIDGDAIKIKLFLGETTAVMKEVYMDEYDEINCLFGRTYSISVCPYWLNDKEYEAWSINR